ncbi:MAG: DUF2520 domain-containing protein [Acidimicrobiia bacterium]|nr:DUF2520 domain-containing protein [Acidimicrobiia bacterium]
MNIAIVGTGRAAGALARVFVRAGHSVTSVDGRNREAADALEATVGADHGSPDLIVIAVADDAIGEVAERLARDIEAPYAVHVSGAVPVAALAPLARVGVGIGSFHPLQTMPDPVTGAAALPGCAVAVTADEPLRGTLYDLARSFDATPFDITDDVKPVYHAAAAASANYVTTALALAERLYVAAGVDPSCAQPLVEAVVRNAFVTGARAALTGPIARGDVATVRAQLGAVERHAPDSYDTFIELARATARLAGTADRFSEVLG